MANWLQCYGIYPDAINDAADAIEEGMLKLGFTTDERNAVHSWAEDMIEKYGKMSDITNSIIWALFRAFYDYAINEKKLDVRIYYYVNCSDSHLYINGEEVWL